MTDVLKIIKNEILKNNLEAAVMPARKIALAEWARIKCIYGCEMYGKSWSCPPAAPSVEESRKMVSEYRSALLLRFPSKNLSDQKRMQKPVLDIEKKLFLSGFYRAFAFFPGPCAFCKTCRYPKQCRSPKLKRPAVEAFGIDIFRTARDIGFGIGVIKNPKDFEKSFSLILVE